MNHPENIAIIGCGKFTNSYLKILNGFGNEVCVSNLCSRSTKSISNITENLPKNFHWSNDYKVACSKPEIDIVIIATPPESHYEITKFALQNKKHVICEKPFVFEIEQAKELKKIAEENKVSLVIDYIHLWNKFYQNAFQNINGVTEVKFRVGSPKTGREHHSILWDWATHECAMISHLFPLEEFKKCDVIIEKEKLDSFLSFCLKNDNLKISCFFDIDSKSKYRSIKLIKKDGSYSDYFDTFDQNPLEQVVADVINANRNNINISNIDLAIKTTEILTLIQRELNNELL